METTSLNNDTALRFVLSITNKLTYILDTKEYIMITEKNIHKFTEATVPSYLLNPFVNTPLVSDTNMQQITPAIIVTKSDEEIVAELRAKGVKTKNAKNCVTDDEKALCKATGNISTRKSRKKKKQELFASMTSNTVIGVSNTPLITSSNPVSNPNAYPTPNAYSMLNAYSTPTPMPNTYSTSIPNTYSTPIPNAYSTPIPNAYPQSNEIITLEFKPTIPNIDAKSNTLIDKNIDSVISNTSTIHPVNKKSYVSTNVVAEKSFCLAPPISCCFDPSLVTSLIPNVMMSGHGSFKSTDIPKSINDNYDDEEEVIREKKSRLNKRKLNDINYIIRRPKDGYLSQDYKNDGREIYRILTEKNISGLRLHKDDEKILKKFREMPKFPELFPENEF